MTAQGSSSEHSAQRIHYIDWIRAYAIMLVLYYHFCFIGKGFDAKVQAFYPAVNYGMTLFFFLSGYLFNIEGNRSIMDSVKSRFTNQLIPTFFTGGLFTLIAGMSFSGLFFGPTKNGYWFVPALISGILLYAPVIYLMKYRIKKLFWRNLIMIASILAIYPLYFIFIKYQDALPIFAQRVLDLIDMYHILKNLPYFILGLMMRLNHRLFQQLITNVYLIGLWILGAILTVNVNASVEVGLTITLYPMVFAKSVICIMLVFTVFRALNNALPASSLIGRALTLTGRHSLTIYFLHYFFYRSYMTLPFVNDAPIVDFWPLREGIYLTIMVFTCICSIAVAKFLSLSPPLYRIFLGKPFK